MNTENILRALDEIQETINRIHGLDVKARRPDQFIVGNTRPPRLPPRAPKPAWDPRADKEPDEVVKIPEPVKNPKPAPPAGFDLED